MNTVALKLTNAERDALLALIAKEVAMPTFRITGPQLRAVAALSDRLKHSAE